MRRGQPIASIIDGLRRRARALRIDVYALVLAYRDPRVPLHARVFAACVVAYAFSPLDLIPDFIPVIGYLDDLILVPLGIALALKMIPAPVLADCRLRAREEMARGKPVNKIAAVVIGMVWLSLAMVGLAVALRWLRR